MTRPESSCPKIHGRMRIDDRRAGNGIVFLDRDGLLPRDELREYGPPKTLFNRKEMGRKGAVIDAEGPPMRFFTTPAQVSECNGLTAPPGACERQRGCWKTGARTPTGPQKRLKTGIETILPDRTSRANPIRHDKRRSKGRNRHLPAIEKERVPTLSCRMRLAT